MLIELGINFRRSSELTALFLFFVIPILRAKRFVVPVVGLRDISAPFGPGRVCVCMAMEKALLKAVQSPNRTCESFCIRGDSKTLQGMYALIEAFQSPHGARTPSWLCSRLFKDLTGHISPPVFKAFKRLYRARKSSCI